MKCNRFIAILFVASFIAFAGCEWEGISEEDAYGEAWLSKFGWVAFSGMYRGAGPSGYLVALHAYTAGTDLEEDTSSEDDDDDDDDIVPVVGEFDFIAGAFHTTLSGTVTYGPSMIPGSLTIVMTPVDPNASLSGGNFRDNGNGTLTGSFNLAGPDTPEYSGSGTIDYNTGVWTLLLVEPGFVVDMIVTLSYSHEEGGEAVVPQTPTATTGGATALEPGNSGDPIYTMYVEQNGNQLTFTDSSDAVYTGTLSRISTTGGNADGTSSDEVIAQFTVTGVSASGANVKIKGTFSGIYNASAGTLDNRILQGIWSETGRTGDVLAQASSAGNATTASTTTTTTE
ncbi:MAG: hypothetical protein JXN60_04635 [Lentisphaerae bacterium]|nr:hypothetical protein [Lentisphaerota bacterium]